MSNFELPYLKIDCLKSVLSMCHRETMTYTKHYTLHTEHLFMQVLVKKAHSMLMIKVVHIAVHLNAESF